MESEECIPSSQIPEWLKKCMECTHAYKTIDNDNEWKCRLRSGECKFCSSSYKPSEINRFAKDCAYGANQMLNGACIAEEITNTEIGKVFANGISNSLLTQISIVFARHVKDQMAFDVETGEVQNFQNIISKIVTCCEENNWFDIH